MVDGLPNDASPAWFHADRAAGGDCDHRGLDRPAAARGPGGPRGGAAGAVRQQPEADRAGDRQLRVGHRLHRVGVHQFVQRQLRSAIPLPQQVAVPGYNPDPHTGDNGPGWGWLALLLPQTRAGAALQCDQRESAHLGRRQQHGGHDSDQRLPLPVGEQPDADVRDGRRQPEPAAGGEPVLRPRQLPVQRGLERLGHAGDCQLRQHGHGVQRADLPQQPHHVTPG